MLRPSSLFRVIFILLLLVACGSPAAPASETQAPAPPLVRIRLPMGYIPNVQYAPFYVADAKGFFRDAGIEVEFDYKSETDGIALVGANELQFTLASGEQVLLARAQGLPVVYVMGWWQDYPVGVAAKQASNIRTPADLAGKRIGLPGPFGASYVGLRALLSVAGLDETDVTLDSIGFNQVEALVADRADAVVIYANNEPLQLSARGYEVDVIRVADYVELASNGLVTNEATLAQNPDLIRRMVQATLRGLEETIADPQEAFGICMDYVEGLDEADQAIQTAILNASIDFWKADRLGFSPPESWENMQKVLLQMGLLDKPLELSQAYTNDFVTR